MKKTLAIFSTLGLLAVFLLNNAPSEAKTAKPSYFGLQEGDLISAIFSDDPDVYIVNQYGYKRLFLNPEIFKFYSHLGGFVNVKLVTTEVRDAFITSGLFRNCEKSDPKVYGVDVDGEDTGKLRWVDVPANAALTEDAEFFDKVFCINEKEFSWYPKGLHFTHVKDIPKYERMLKRDEEKTEKKLNTGAAFKGTGKVIVCHRPPDNISASHEITIAPAALEAHLAHGDTLGVCNQATPTPSVTPTSTPTVSPSPSVTPTSTPSVSPSPSATPIPTSSPTPEPTPTPSITPTPTPMPTPTPIPAPRILTDDFNSYTNGSIVGQGGWSSYANGDNFVVQGTTVYEGAKAIYANAPADSVINKAGTPLSDGMQTVYVRTENRASWGSYANGNAQVRISKGIWGGSELRNFAAVSFKSDGNVAYYDAASDAYLNFATYSDNAWTLLEFEWRSSDKKARFKVASGSWTDWKLFAGSGAFTDFDHVGFDFYLPSGSGGFYIDTLH